MEKLSKSKLIELVTDNTGLAKKNVKAVIDSVFDTISTAVENKQVVSIQGFGRFFTKEAKPRQFRRINSTETVSVAARSLPKIKFSKRLVDKIKGV